MTILVTGGAGFIGSAFIRKVIGKDNLKIINVDKLTYSGNLNNLQSAKDNKNYTFYEGDICDKDFLEEIFTAYKPSSVIHFAAESHVDNSIQTPVNFMNSNFMGTFHLLEAVKKYLNQNDNMQKTFKFIHISTDEVYGALELDDEPFTEQSQILPNSPYSASKAGSNHLARAYQKTFNIPIIITNCSNNYGPYQHHEKLIPRIISCALKGIKLPIYGKGEQIRDWIHVDDHIEAINTVLDLGKIGESYNIGADNEIRNIDLVREICNILDTKILDLKEKYDIQCSSFHELISFVEDRLGHDFRYAIKSHKIKQELGWQSTRSMHEGLKETIEWYLNNTRWLDI